MFLDDAARRYFATDEKAASDGCSVAHQLVSIAFEGETGRRSAQRNHPQPKVQRGKAHHRSR